MLRVAHLATPSGYMKQRPNPDVCCLLRCLALHTHYPGKHNLLKEASRPRHLVTYTILGVPYYSHTIIYGTPPPQTLFEFLRPLC